VIQITAATGTATVLVAVGTAAYVGWGARVRSGEAG
jgi:hypothetical protein